MSTPYSLDSAIRKIPDFPKPGILFYDITGILVDPKAFRFCIDQMVKLYKNRKIDAIAAIESRGFVFAAPFAERMAFRSSLFVRKENCRENLVLQIRARVRFRGDRGSSGGREARSEHPRDG
jgi:adenine phosphoribosyltransferase